MKVILAGDIGGTKTLLGLFEADPSTERRAGGARPLPIRVGTFSTLDYAGLPAIIEEFLATGARPPAIERAAFGVAGPVIDQEAEMTNVPWRVDAAELSRWFALPSVRLLNDLEAMAYSVPVLSGAELHQLQEGQPEARGNLALIAAGTGLGMSLLHWVHDRYVPIPSEGGHADFAARTERDIELVGFLRQRYGRAEIEHVLSGPGLINLSNFAHADSPCAALEGADEMDIPARVSAAALAGTCPHCQEALDLFVAAYGAVAGNLALTAVTRGGVFIGGGIAPRILPALERGAFSAAFCDKPPMRPLLEAMPVHVILNAQAGLLGAAVYASQ